MRNLSGAVCAAVLATAAWPALGSDLVTAGDVDRIAEIARGFGSATVETDPVGDPMIVGRMDGTQYGVLFYGCTDGSDCRDIQFFTRWTAGRPLDVAAINDWNAATRFAKAYLDAEGDPVLEFAVNLFGGVSETNLDDTFDWWRLLMDGFAADVLRE